MARKLAALFLAVTLLSASEQHGQVKFGGLPVPGATVTATQNEKALTVITDSQGSYSFPDLADGTWTIQVEMQGFAAIKQAVTVARDAPASQWDLKMLPLNEMKAVTAPTTAPSQTPAVAVAQPTPRGKGRNRKAPPAPTNTPGAFQRTDVNAAGPNASAATAPGGDASASSGAFANQSSSDLSQRASDGLLINGTANNGASSPFAQAQAFGNNRRGTRSLYSGNLGLVFDTAALDARPFSITGQDTPKLPYGRYQLVFAFGGPFKIPHLVSNGGNFYINYQRTRTRQVATGSFDGLMPTAAERIGDFSHVLSPFGKPLQIIDPTTGAPFPGNVIPQSLISPQAKALLPFFPLPNFAGGTRFNYQIPLLGNSHDDSLQARYNKTIARKNFISALFAMDSTRLDNPNIFQFLDTRSSLGMNIMGNFRHNFTPRFFTNLGGQFTRFAARVTPFFANRENISGEAGITGNNQAPLNWGPPSLNFTSGITSLSDGLPSWTRTQTATASVDNLWARARHNISFGGDFRRQQFNLLSQQDPRGSFTFTGAATGSDFAGFLLGVPDTSSIAFGNADKYLRASTIEAYVNDDWRMSPGFTLNVGVRWEYWSPITEKYGRLVNLDVAPGFSAVAPVLASDPVGPLTSQKYPDSLMNPYKRGLQPRVALSWRPFAASSLVVRAGYGVYYNTSVYYPIASLLDQQPPLSKSLNVANSPANPLTLANGFNFSPTITPNTVAVDPNFRPGYSQNWQVSVQRDLPAALVLTVLYLGSKGTHQVQDFLPNSYPLGAENPCPGCPVGFQYLVSNGNSTREAGQIQLRRRLQSGFTASLDYTYAKAIDDAALGGRNQGTPLIAQNWLDLDAERGLSNFDQRHLLTAQIQYTTGMGLRGGTLVNGWKGALFKEWTLASQITAGTGLPLTPIYPFPVPGTGVTGPLRPQYTGAPLYQAPEGLFLNPAAFVLPPVGEWGNAGRDSITGPAQFGLNASLGRVFQVSDRFSLDFRVDATNALNHVTFPSWNTTITNAQFGLPATANAMRSLQTTLRLRF
ncbi:MAG TPA: carboxypeptidase regulatory-like domain-containing protein [Bryobacteraceae bacterium]|nr:carboxypeptidase regulatory-like domain-containing protein [Bryobacteraceae bacterium]